MKHSQRLSERRIWPETSGCLRDRGSPMFMNKFIYVIRRTPGRLRARLASAPDYRRTLSFTGKKFMEFTDNAEAPFTSVNVVPLVHESARSLSRFPLIAAVLMAPADCCLGTFLARNFPLVRLPSFSPLSTSRRSTGGNCSSPIGIYDVSTWLFSNILPPIFRSSSVGRLANSWKPNRKDKAL